MSENRIEKVVIWLVNGLTVEQAIDRCRKEFGLQPSQAKRAVSEARKRLTLAADYTRVEQLGSAITRLQNLYAVAIEGGDIRTALQAQKELNKLMNLYRHVEFESDGEEYKHRLRTVERYLLPLELTDADAPIEEHARIAANIIRETRS